MHGGTPCGELHIRTTSPHTVLRCSVGRARLSAFVTADAAFIAIINHLILGVSAIT